jgi:hypothetical protein
MASLLAYVPLVNRLLAPASTDPVFDVPPSEVHDLENSTDRRARCLKHLLRANHANYAIIYHDLQFDNHNVHILCSAYLLGAREDQLRAIYDKQIESLEPWSASPCEVTDDDWSDFLGDRRFQRAYVDFFEDKLVEDFSYGWKKLVEHYMFKHEHRLVYSLFGGRTWDRVPPSVLLSRSVH